MSSVYWPAQGFFTFFGFFYFVRELFLGGLELFLPLGVLCGRTHQ
jgi:hypothetical protein